MNEIKNYPAPFIIAEIGCNHMGNLAIAKEMILNAKNFCAADAVKFQKRNITRLLSTEQYNAPHPNPANAYGETYGAHREYLEFNLEQHAEFKAFCDEIGIIYACSVWDLSSAKEIASLNPKFIKIPSACNNNFELLDWLCNHYPHEIHLSTGMTTKQEIEEIVCFFESKNRHQDLVLYNCTSGYPVDFEDVCLLEINYLKNNYQHRIKQLGFSGHHLGIAVDVAAYTLGATVIERHFTLNRTWKGTDHAASLEPEGLRKLCRDLRAVHKSLQYKSEDILPIEKIQRDKLKYKP